MTKHKDIMLDNPEMRYENPGEWEVRRELDRLGIENEPVPEKCDTCGSENLGSAPGMVGETMIVCNDCGRVLWCDDEGAIRAVY